MTIAYIGIDPGKTGAMALYTTDECRVWDYEPHGLIDALRCIQREHTLRLAALERVHSMPRDGGTASFTFGANFGWWRGVLEAFGIPYVEVLPQRWMKDCGVPQKQDRTDKPGLVVARKMFPMMIDHLARKKDDGRADALLIAWWASKQA